MNNFNLNNILNGNEFIFSIPFNDNNDIFQTIENMLEDLQNNPNIINIINNNNDYIQFDIQYDFDDIDNENTNNSDYNNYELNGYFKDCNEINTILSKSEKIKKNDVILSEQCFICMEDYKESQLKRILPNCKHYYHKKCIDKWLKKKASCPICRDDCLQIK
jgi:hypothetical protein